MVLSIIEMPRGGSDRFCPGAIRKPIRGRHQTPFGKPRQPNRLFLIFRRCVSFDAPGRATRQHLVQAAIFGMPLVPICQAVACLQAQLVVLVDKFK
jgi:hypothetical protein